RIWLSSRTEESRRSSASTAGSISWASSTTSTGRDREGSMCVCQRSRSSLAPPQRVFGRSAALDKAPISRYKATMAALGGPNNPALAARGGREPLARDAQRDGLACARTSSAESKTALGGELLAPPAEGLDARRHVKRLGRHVGSERVPLEAVECQQLLV